MTDSCVVYDINSNMQVIPNPDIVHLVGCYELTGNTDLNSSSVIDIPFDSASYSALSGFVNKSSSYQFDIVKSGIYRIDFYCSCDDSSAKVRIDVMKNSSAISKSELNKNCSISVIESFSVNDYVIIRSNRLGSDSSQLSVSAGFSKLIISKLG